MKVALENNKAGRVSSGRDALLRLVNLRDQELWQFRDRAFQDHPVFQVGLKLDVRDLLRRAWNSKIEREQNWYLFALRRLMGRYQLWKYPPEPLGDSTEARLAKLDRWLLSPPPPSPLDEALYSLQINLHQLRICKRGDKCQERTHYFISEQADYCCAACRRAARAEEKRNWWKEHGQSEAMKRKQHERYLARKRAGAKTKKGKKP
jgi:hypothetical protein